MKVTRTQLNDIVKDLIPSEYQPGGVGSFVTSIELIPQEEMQIWTKSKIVNCDSKSIVRGLCVRWGILGKMACLPGWEKEMHSHAIFLDDNPPGGMFQTAFTVAHEVGHVNWTINRKSIGNWEKEDEEKYADFYAYEILNKKFGMDKAVSLLSMFGSAEGLGKQKERKING